MDDNFPALAGLCLVGLAIRAGYELLKKSGRIDTKNPAVFALVFVAMGAMLGSWPVMCPLDPWPLALPAVAAWVGLASVAAGVVLAFGALAQLRGVENIDHLVTTGVFSRLRHPMYTGFILWIAGWVMRYGAGISFLLGLVCIANILHWRSLEERALESAYGEPYQTYRRRTWF